MDNRLDSQPVLDGRSVLEVIRRRRSVRKYRPEPLPDELLRPILDAGRYAPSGGNSQTCHFLAIRDPAVLSELRQLVTREFAKMEITETMYPSIKNSIARSRGGRYDFFYNAPALVVVANRKGYGNAMADSAAAIENMLLAADALGVGSCWINQLHWLDENAAVRQYLYTLGLAEDETVCGSAALGYAAEAERPPLPRTGNPVEYI